MYPTISRTAKRDKGKIYFWDESSFQPMRSTGRRGVIRARRQSCWFSASVRASVPRRPSVRKAPSGSPPNVGDLDRPTVRGFAARDAAGTLETPASDRRRTVGPQSSRDQGIRLGTRRQADRILLVWLSTPMSWSGAMPSSPVTHAGPCRRANG